MIALQELDKNPIDLYNDDDEEEWDTPTRRCIECGEPLSDDWFYDLCSDCLAIKSYKLP